MNRISLPLVVGILVFVLMPFEAFSFQEATANYSQTEIEAPSLESVSLIFADLDISNNRVLV